MNEFRVRKGVKLGKYYIYTCNKVAIACVATITTCFPILKIAYLLENKQTVLKSVTYLSMHTLFAQQPLLNKTRTHH